MSMFNSDLFRAFSIGFVIAALVQLVPHFA
jgi:hypothetical protein